MHSSCKHPSEGEHWYAQTHSKFPLVTVKVLEVTYATVLLEIEYKEGNEEARYRLGDIEFVELIKGD